MQIEITETVARKVLSVVDAGLSSGLGNPTPGNMCVEAAVCFALGLPHGDDPECVSPVLRSLKIRINDSTWSSKAARAKGLRRLAVAQLGSKDALDEKEFVRRVVEMAISVSVPQALRSAASTCKDAKHRQAMLDAANRCEIEKSRASAQDARTLTRAAAAYAYAAADAAAAADADANAAANAYAYAYAAANAAANAAVRDESLATYCEAIVQILIEMKAPGCQWLPFTELEAA